MFKHNVVTDDIVVVFQMTASMACIAVIIPRATLLSDLLSSW